MRFHRGTVLKRFDFLGEIKYLLDFKYIFVVVVNRLGYFCGFVVVYSV